MEPMDPVDRDERTTAARPDAAPSPIDPLLRTSESRAPQPEPTTEVAHARPRPDAPRTSATPRDRHEDLAPARVASPPVATNSTASIPVTRVASSFDAFYAAERDGLVRAISIVEANPTVAADLVDEAMARAYQRWSQVSQLDRPGGWVYRVAVNLGRSRFRRLRLDVKYRLLMAGPDQSGAIEDEFFDRVDDSPLMSALMDLPLKQRSVVVARVLLDYSEAEVATALDIPPGTVKSRLNRALTTLRRAVPELAPAVARYQPTTLQPQGTNS